MAVRMFAAIEVGSFELEMGIYEISGKNRIRQVDHVRHVISLGSDTYNDRKISYEMVEELCRVLEDFSRIMKGYRITEYRAYATSAMREAKNSRIVLEQIRVRTGLTVQIISNSEQRLLTYKALAVADDEFDRNIRKGTAILDVGFGSMQISLFDEKLLVSTENLPLGVLRIGELLKNVSSTAEGTRRIIGEMVESELSNYQKMYLEERRIKHVIGTGENIMYLFRYEDGGKPLQWVTREQFDRLYERLSGMDPEAVEEQFGVSAEVSVLNTAAAAKKVMEEGDKTQAAVASRTAGELYGLAELKTSISNERGNTTRFLVLSREPVYEKKASKVTVTFEVPHVSGSLYKILGNFIFNGVNMRMIESRPIPDKPFEYRFFVDIEGNLSHAPVHNALAGIQAEASSMKILGNY